MSIPAMAWSPLAGAAKLEMKETPSSFTVDESSIAIPPAKPRLVTAMLPEKLQRQASTLAFRKDAPPPMSAELLDTVVFNMFRKALLMAMPPPRSSVAVPARLPSTSESEMSKYTWRLLLVPATEMPPPLKRQCCQRYLSR